MHGSRYSQRSRSRLAGTVCSPFRWLQLLITVITALARAFPDRLSTLTDRRRHGIRQSRHRHVPIRLRLGSKSIGRRGGQLGRRRLGLQSRRGDSQNGGVRLDRELRSLAEEVTEETQLGVPLSPFRFGSEQIVTDVAEELDLHDVYLLHGDTGDLGPRLIGVGVIVQNCE